MTRIWSHLLFAAVAVGLCGCADQTSDFAKFYGLVSDQLSGGDGITRDKAAAIPYATIGVRSGESGSAIMVLATETGQKRMWLQGNDVALVTQEGRIVQTVGFPNNLNNLETIDNNGAQSDYSYDLSNPTIYGVPVHCVRRNLGEEKLEIIGTEFSTRHEVEDCRAPAMGWTFTNEFWRDLTTGRILRSIQYTNPQQDPFEIEVLRPEEQ